MMPKLSTARESLARLDKRIAAEADPRRKAWLKTYRDHWWCEVMGDVDGVMATMSHGPIHYTFDGHPFMIADMSAIKTHEDTRRMYAGVVELGAMMAGPVDEERIAFDEFGIIGTSILTAIYPGIYLAPRSEPVDPKASYLLRWPNVTMVRFDAAGLMMGEEIFNGAPLLVQKTDPANAAKLIDGPLDFI